MKSVRYFNLPPSDGPDFIYRLYPRSIVKYAQDLISWSTKEYNDGLRCWAKQGRYNDVRRLANEYSPMRLLAEMQGFKKMVAFMSANESTWNSLSWRDRIFIRRAWEIHEKLR